MPLCSRSTSPTFETAGCSQQRPKTFKTFSLFNVQRGRQAVYILPNTWTCSSASIASIAHRPRQAGRKVSVLQMDKTQLVVHRRPAAQPWHNAGAHRLIRKLMILRLRRLYPALADTGGSVAVTLASSSVACQGSEQGNASSTSATTGGAQRASLAQRLEWMLYHAAFSLEEYGNQRSLERRIRALATHIEPSAAMVQRLCGSKRVVGGDFNEREKPGKRRRQEESDEICEMEQLEINAIDQSELFLGNDNCLVSHVMSFLDGADVLKCRGVNRFIRDAAPGMVRTLKINARIAGLKSLQLGSLGKLLHACENLTALTMGNQLNRGNAVLTSSSHGASPLQLDPNTCPMPCSARRVLTEVAKAFEGGACPHMQFLTLDAPMDHLVESSEVLQVMEAFATGREMLAASRVKAAPLKELRLEATFLGDRRIERLAEMLRKGSEGCFSSLETLSLSNNYIGAGGCRALMDALPHLPALASLDLSCNILTDLDAVALVDVLERRPSMHLQSLCVDDNFIEQPGQEALRLADSMRGCRVSMARLTAGARSHGRRIGLGGIYR